MDSLKELDDDLDVDAAPGRAVATAGGADDQLQVSISIAFAHEIHQVYLNNNGQKGQDVSRAVAARAAAVRLRLRQDAHDEVDFNLDSRGRHGGRGHGACRLVRNTHRQK